MCELYDMAWKPALVFLLFFSILTVLVRFKYAGKGGLDRAAVAPQWLPALLFWGSGLVGLVVLALMVLGFVCVGSPGDIKSYVPN